MSDLMELAKRITDVVNGLRDKPPLTPETVDLRMVPELCWALGVTPQICFEPFAALASPPTEEREGR